MANLVCLFCDRVMVTKSSIKPTTKCGVCNSRDLIPLETLYSIADEVAEYMDRKMLSTVSYLEIMNVVIQKLGIRLRPVSTIRLLSKIHDLLEKKWKQDMSDSLSVNTDRGRSL